MPNLANTLKQEIARIARKELRREVDGLRKTVSGYRSEIAALKRTNAELQRALNALSRQTSRGPNAARNGSAESDAAASRLRFRPSGLASNRKRLGLSAADFGALVGATGQSVYLWEQGKSRPSDKSLAAISGLRGIGKREVAARLAALKKGKRT